MADVIEIDAETGETIERDFTPEELAQRQADEAAAAEARAAEQVVKGNRTTLADRATAALAANRDYLALESPTAAEAIAQVDRLTRQNTAIIRLLLGLVDEVD